MNHSIYSVDRMTHLKVVVVALAASIVVASFGILNHVNTDDGYVQTARIIRADRPVMMTSSAVSIIR